MLFGALSSRGVLVAAAVAAAGGCQSAGPYRFEVREVDSTNFAFRDERPLEQRAAYESYAPSQGGFRRLGDNELSPSPPALFSSWLQHNLGPDLSGKTVVLNEFLVMVSESVSRAASSAVSPVPGASTGANVAGILAGSAMEQGAGRGRAEKTLSVRISGKVDGREFSGQSRRMGTDFHGAIRQALDRSVIQIQEQLAPGNSGPK
jgi:hypothetical protein